MPKTHSDHRKRKNPTAHEAWMRRKKEVNASREGLKRIPVYSDDPLPEPKFMVIR